MYFWTETRAEAETPVNPTAETSNTAKQSVDPSTDPSAEPSASTSGVSGVSGVSGEKAVSGEKMEVEAEPVKHKADAVSQLNYPQRQRV